MSKLNVISGCPRSGTSVMSLCLLHAVGEENLLGKKFPQRDKTARASIEAIPNEEVRDYYLAKLDADPSSEPDLSGIVDMNPTGFWECRYSVRGITWHQNLPDLTGAYCKIVSQGIARSNPDYIGKIVFMARHPRQVAKSQERLKRTQLPEGVVIHSPEMFITVSTQVARWIVAHDKAADMLVVDYDHLIAEPRTQLDRVADFLDIPRDRFDASLVDPKLKRSQPEEIPHHLWEPADEIFAAMQKSDWQGIIDAGKRHRAIINRDKTPTRCDRLEENMCYNECVNCIHNASTRTTFRRRATAKGIDWLGKPCMFLCHTAPDIPLVPLQDTIENNHWLTEADFTPPSISRIAAMALGTLGRVAGSLLKGRRILARKDIVARRQAACDTCPFREGENCTQCTCPIKRAVKFADKTCPKGRWPEQSPTQSKTARHRHP